MDSSGDFTCRICLAETESKHSTALFTATGLSQGWPSRLTELLQVDVAKDDGLPRHICRSCRGKVATIEGKLQNLRALAQESLRKLRGKCSGERKRSKDTSGGLGICQSRDTPFDGRRSTTPSDGTGCEPTTVSGGFPRR